MYTYPHLGFPTGPARIIYLFVPLQTPPPFRGTSPWSQGINPSLPGTRLIFWSRGLGQLFRTASTHNKQTQLTTLFTHVLTRSMVGLRLHEKKKPSHLESNPRSPHPTFTRNVLDRDRSVSSLPSYGLFMWRTKDPFPPPCRTTL